MTKHSPGPWRAKRIHRHSSDRVVYDAKDSLVAHIWIGDDDEEGLANLRLVLKATELLALVQKLPGFRCYYPSDQSCQDCPEAVYCPRMVAPTLLKEIDGGKSCD